MANWMLEQVCVTNGIEVQHPQRGRNVPHKETPQYKIEKEIEKKERVLDALKVKLERLEKASRYKMNASQKQQIQSLQGKLNQLKQTSKLALTDSQLNEIDKLRNRLANLSSKYTLEQQIEIAGLKKKKQIYQQTLETLSKPLSKELQAQVDYWNA